MKKKPRRHVKSVPEAAPEPGFGKWSCSQSGQRLVCHKVGGDEHPWWVPLVFGLVIFIVLGLPFFAGGVFFFLAVQVSMWFGGGPAAEDDYPGLIVLIAAIVAAYSFIFAGLGALLKTVYRFEIDFDRQEFVLSVSSYPNRTRIAVVPFAEVISVNLCYEDFKGGNLQLYYQQGRRRRYAQLGDELPDALLIEQLDRLKLAIGDKVTAPVRSDP